MDKVKIYIDRKVYESPKETTGANLYVLGGVDASTHDLWQEEQGKEDDQLIENNANPVHVKEWDHFYSAQRELNPGCYE